MALSSALQPPSEHSSVLASRRLCLATMGKQGAGGGASAMCFNCMLSHAAPAYWWVVMR